MILKIIAIFLVAAGAAIGYGAKFIVERFSLDDKVGVKEAGEFSGEELEKHKKTKAMAMVKIAGFIVLLPGLILLILAFR
jgi:hypothetical protein